MTSITIKIFSVIAGILIIYAVPCFLAHYVDFGCKFSTGKWLHEDFFLVKRLRSGVFHKILIGFILIIILYAGLSEALTIVPAGWGSINKEGQLQPYRRLLAISLAVLIGVINMYAFSTAETHFSEKEKAVGRDKNDQV